MRLCLVVLVVGCANPDPVVPMLDDNVLDHIDPASGFVADAWASTDAALQAGRRAQVSEPDRILLASDPLGVARLVAELDRERTYCKTPPCALDAEIQTAITSYSQKSAEYTPVLAAHHDAMSAWAAVAAAHQALAIANVLDQAGTLTAGGRDEIRQAADGLRSAGLNAGAFITLDWTTVMAATTADPRISEEIVAHAPVIVPLPAIETAAVATVAAVLAEVDREGVPLAPLCCSKTIKARLIGSPAYQSLRRLALLREWTARGDATTAIEAYRGGLVSLAAKSLSGAVSDPTWSGYRVDSKAYAALESTLQSTVDAASFIMDPDFSHVGISGPYDDANAWRPVSNVANIGPADRGAYWEDVAPSVELVSTATVPHVNSSDEIYVPDYMAVPSPTPGDAPTANDGATEVAPAAPIVIEWSLHMAAPIDHLDLRIARDVPGAEPFVHYIERPNGSMFPTRTAFDPETMDPEAPEVLPEMPLRVDYIVTAIAVDVRGRASRQAVTYFRVRFQAHPPGPWQEYELFLRDGEPTRATTTVRITESDDIGPHGLPPGQLTIRRYTTSTGTTIRFEPGYVTVIGTSGMLTVNNTDSAAHHLRAVYTAPYLVDPSLTSLAIGGVQPLDLGVVPGGNVVTVPLPAGAVNRTQWSLYDPDIAAPRPQRFTVTVSAP